MTMQMRACNCIGPQNGDPVCPCQMDAYRQRERERAALALLTRATTKPRVRVKAPSRQVA